MSKTVLEGRNACFLRSMAPGKSGLIRREDYFRLLLAHFQGARHLPEDNLPSCSVPLRAFEPWAGSLRDLALYTTYETLKGAYCGC